MAASVVQSHGAEIIGGTAAGSGTIATSSNVTANNWIAVCLTWMGSTTGITVAGAGTRGDTSYTVIGPQYSPPDTGAQNGYSAILYAKVTSAGTETVTLTFSGGTATHAEATIVEMGGIVATSPLDASGTVASGLVSGLATVNTSANTTQNGDLVVAVFFDNEFLDELGAGTGYSLLDSNPLPSGSGYSLAEYQVQSTAGATSATATDVSFPTGSGNFTASIAAFAPAAAVTTHGQFFRMM
jgi:hypothetical protein